MNISYHMYNINQDDMQLSFMIYVYCNYARDNGDWHIVLIAYMSISDNHI